MIFFKKKKNIELVKEKSKKEEIYRKGDKLKAKETIRFYGIAKDIVYTVSEWHGWEVYFEEVFNKVYGFHFERATENDIKRSTEIMKKFIEDKKIKKTVNPFVAYVKYLNEKEIEEYNIALHKSLES